MLNKNGESIKVLIAGGGTGGHLYPGIAIAEEIKSRFSNADIHFVGTSTGIESRVVPNLGYKLHLISIKGFKRKLDVSNLAFPFCLAVSFFQGVKLLNRLGPQAVVGTGGYVSGPILFLTAMYGIPTLIQEQNSLPGVTTRLLAYFVDRVHLSFKESAKYFSSHNKLRVTGNPVRSLKNRKSKINAKKLFNLDQGRPTLLVFGGSQGARAINETMLKVVPIILDRTLVQIIWGTGRPDYAQVKMEMNEYQDQVKILEYISDMNAAYAASDLVICRSGASTLAEITLCGKPSILIPYPHAAAGHQETNARALEKAGGAVVILQKDLEKTVLADKIIELLNNEKKRKEMGDAAKTTSYPNAAKEIVDSLLEIIPST